MRAPDAHPRARYALPGRAGRVSAARPPRRRAAAKTGRAGSEGGPQVTVATQMFARTSAAKRRNNWASILNGKLTCSRIGSSQFTLECVRSDVMHSKPAHWLHTCTDGAGDART